MTKLEFFESLKRYEINEFHHRFEIFAYEKHRFDIEISHHSEILNLMQ